MFETIKTILTWIITAAILGGIVVAIYMVLIRMTEMGDVREDAREKTNKAEETLRPYDRKRKGW